jgi:hypothetical protein
MNLDHRTEVRLIGKRHIADENHANCLAN